MLPAWLIRGLRERVPRGWGVVKGAGMSERRIFDAATDPGHHKIHTQKENKESEKTQTDRDCAQMMLPLIPFATMCLT